MRSRSWRRNQSPTRKGFMIVIALCIVLVLYFALVETPRTQDGLSSSMMDELVHWRSSGVGEVMRTSELLKLVNPWISKASDFSLVLIGPGATKRANDISSHHHHIALFTILDDPSQSFIDSDQSTFELSLWNQIMGPTLDHTHPPWQYGVTMMDATVLQDIHVILNVWDIIPPTWVQSPAGSPKHVGFCQLIGWSFASKMSFLAFGCSPNDHPKSCDGNALKPIIEGCLASFNHQSRYVPLGEQTMVVETVLQESANSTSRSSKYSSRVVMSIQSITLVRRHLIHHQSCLEHSTSGWLPYWITGRLCDRFYDMRYISHGKEPNGDLPLSQVDVRGTWYDMTRRGYNVGTFTDLSLIPNVWMRVSIWTRLLSLPLGNDIVPRNAMLIAPNELVWIDHEHLASIPQWTGLSNRVHEIYSHMVIGLHGHSNVTSIRMGQLLFDLLWRVHRNALQRERLQSILGDEHAYRAVLEKFTSTREDSIHSSIEPFERLIWFSSLMELDPYFGCMMSIDEIDVARGSHGRYAFVWKHHPSSSNNCNNNGLWVRKQSGNLHRLFQCGSGTRDFRGVLRNIQVDPVDCLVRQIVLSKD